MTPTDTVLDDGYVETALAQNVARGARRRCKTVRVLGTGVFSPVENLQASGLVVPTGQEPVPTALSATLPTRRGSSADVTVDPPPSAGNSMVAYPRQPDALPDHEEWAAVSASIRRGGVPSSGSSSLESRSSPQPSQKKDG